MSTTATQPNATTGTEQNNASMDPAASAAKLLFSGRILHPNLFPYPTMQAREEEALRPMLEALDQFLGDRRTNFKQWDRDGAQPEEFIQQLRELGLFGLIIPEEYGGLGLSSASYARILSQVSGHDSSTSLTIGAHSSIGMKGLLLYGTPEQRRRYLPRLATGEMIAAFCLTEPGAGSDAASVRTSARRQQDGSWLLNGEKQWITNGGIADLYTVFARTDGPEGKLTAFIVEAAWPGVSRGAHEDKMGIRASSTTGVSFSDVRVPPENVVGEVGQGFKVAMTILNSGRTGLGGGAVGGMKSLIALAAQYALDRHQFGKPIAAFGLVREKLAQMTLDCFAAESAVWMVAHYVDSGFEDYSIEAAISKVFASDAMTRAAYESLQVAGGVGFMREQGYEQAARDARILPIFEGTNEILRLYIAMSGLRDAGRALEDLREALDEIFSHPIKGFGTLGRYAERRIAQATGVNLGNAFPRCPAELHDACSVFEQYTLELGRAAEHLLRRHGRAVVDRQTDLARIADVAIDLFVGLCVLSRAASLGDAPDALAARRMARVFAQQAKRRMASNLRRLQRNEDDELDALAAVILDRRAYPWDVLGRS
jgi:alkylation response protein AidB-like acyl-CoA dehydrogenase